MWMFWVSVAMVVAVGGVLVRALVRRRLGSTTSPLIINSYTQAVEPDVERLGVQVHMSNSDQGGPPRGQLR